MGWAAATSRDLCGSALLRWGVGYSLMAATAGRLFLNVPDKIVGLCSKTGFE